MLLGITSLKWNNREIYVCMYLHTFIYICLSHFAQTLSFFI